MGVKGLWQLVESSGRPVTLESLESQILAVDVSIWLNQAVRGCRDRQGGPMQNAHLLTLFNRICKLLFYRIKPIFVFDGGVPILKKQTLAARRQRKDMAAQESHRTSQKLLMSLVRSQAVRKKLQTSSADGQVVDGSTPSTSNLLDILPKSSKESDIFELPPLSEEMQKELDSSDEELDVLGSEGDTFISELRRGFQDLDSVDVNSVEFRALPSEIQHEILVELKEQRKKNSWAKMDEMPEDSPSFSSFQMARLLKRRSLQQRLEEVQKDMLSRNSDQTVLQLMGGNASTSTDVVARRIASDENTQYILIKGLKKGGSLIDRSSNELISTLSANAERNERSHPVKTEDESIEKNENLKKDDVSTAATLQSVDAATLQSVDAATLQSVDAGSSAEVKHDSLDDSDVVMLSPKDAADSTVETLGFLQEIAARSTLKSPTTVVNADEGFTKLRTIMPEFVDISETSEEQKVLSSDLKVAFSSASVHSDNSNHMPDSTSNNIHSFADTDIKPDIGERVITCHEVHSVSDESNSSDVVLLEDIPAGDRANKISVIKAAVSTSVPTLAAVNRHSELIKSAGSEVEIKEVTTVSSGSEADSDDDFVEVLSSSKPDAQELFPEEIFKKSYDLEKESEAVSSTSEPSILNPVPTKLESAKIQVEEICEAESSGLEELKSPIGSSVTEQDNEVPPNEGELSLLTPAELEKLDHDLLDEQVLLTKEKSKQDRMASSISDQMYAESQEMLRLFGIPYVVSPMEAEAQCATLDQLQLTHGTITDDSDIWLFGGEKVYKNFFNQNKHVEFYQATDIKTHFGLDRVKLISVALMTGSDYTDGIEGVGYVTALEILGEFPGEGIEPLQAFRQWWEEAQKQIKIPTETKVKEKLRHLTLHPGFPNESVVNAYLEPVVDQSTEKFTWGMPDLDALRDFAQSRFGWTRSKADEILLPVIKRLNEKSIQTRLDSYFQVSTTEKDIEARIPSKRLRRALNKVSKSSVEVSSEIEEDAKIKATNIVQRKRKMGKNDDDSAATSETAGNGQNGEPVSSSLPSTVTKRTKIPFRGKGKRGRGPSGVKRNIVQKRTAEALPSEAHLSEESSQSS